MNNLLPPIKPPNRATLFLRDMRYVFEELVIAAARVARYRPSGIELLWTVLFSLLIYVLYF